MSDNPIATYEREFDFEAPLAQDTLAQKFWAAYREDPKTFGLIYELVMVYFKAGVTYLSMRDIYSELRKKHPGIHLNNTWTRFYTEMCIQKCPELALIFRQRTPAIKRMMKVPARQRSY